MKDLSGESFLSSTVPKGPIQALKFLQDNPDYDGRGVKVAILDTGVDPGAAGLQKTTTGGVKVIDIRDSTGAGDVDTSKTVNAELRTDLPDDEKSYAVLKGIRGNDLKICRSIFESNTANTWHVGQKSLYDILPRRLVHRLQAQSLKKIKKKHNMAIEKAQQELKEWKASHPDKQKLKREEIRHGNELQNRVDILHETLKNKSGSADLTIETGGLVVDCVAFQDSNEIWRVLIDTSESGDLREQKALASYHIEHEYIRLNEESQLNVCVNIYEEGNLVSLVTDVGDHGTHVASILAGYHPENEDLNGVAPGAEIISLKIGDGRLGSMETASSMIRAISMAASLGADIINMSYGEGSTLPQKGRVVELMEELVEKHGVIFVTSAGNSGPALSTVGSPACSSDSIIGVGAYVSPGMMQSQYNMRDEVKINETNYTWTSRGPSYSGNLGVCISAPGGAIASVSEWTLNQKGLKNGTSMASPNACGGVALIVSGLLQQNIKYSPARVKRAIESTARSIENLDRFTQGNGLLQVSTAFEHIVRESIDSNPELWYLDLPFQVRVGNNRGIYLREPVQSIKPSKHSVTILPKFNDSESYEFDVVNSNDNVVAHWPTSYRNKLQVRLNIKVDVDWIKAPKKVFLHGKQSFDIIVDPTKLAPGQYFSWLKVYDEARPENMGALVKVPITVIIPDNGRSQLLGDTASFTNVEFGPGTVVRKFLQVPDGASWMDYKIVVPKESKSVYADRFFYVHCLQMSKLGSYAKDEYKTRAYLANEAGEEIIRSVAVKNGTIEVCVAQFWKSEGTGPVDLQVRFRGIEASPSEATMMAQNGSVAKVVLNSKIRSTRISPSGKLKFWHQGLRPEVSLTKLYTLRSGYRDEILPFRLGSSYIRRPIWNLELQYKFKQLEAGQVKPNLPNINDLLYESPLDSQMCMLYDENKQLIACTDAWPSSISIAKGNYVMRVCLRHENEEVLSNLKQTILIISRPLGDPISISFHKTLSGTIDGSNSFAPCFLDQGTERAVYLKVDPSKLPKGAMAGDTFTGSVTYCSRGSREKGWGGDGRPNGYPVSFVLPVKRENTSRQKLKVQVEEQTEDSKSKVIKTYVVPSIKSRIAVWKSVNLKHKDMFEQETKEILNLIEKYQDSNVEEIGDLKMDLLRIFIDWAVAEHQNSPNADTVSVVEAACNRLLDSIPDGILDKNPIAKVDFDDAEEKTKSEKDFLKHKSNLLKALAVKVLVKLGIKGEMDATIETDLQTIAKFSVASDPLINQIKMER